MHGKFGVDDAAVSASADADDPRSAALHLMSAALACLDSDSNIPAVIGAQLQSAIDALWSSTSDGQLSTHLH